MSLMKEASDVRKSEKGGKEEGKKCEFKRLVMPFVFSVSLCFIEDYHQLVFYVQ